MKFNDDITMSIASTVKDVLEGKAPKEVKEMDPKKHVSKNGDKFDVVNTKGKVVKSFDDEDAANKYATDNHDDLMKESPEEPNKPSGKLGQDSGERDFKNKHVVKKSGENPDGTVTKEAKEDEEEDEKKEGNAFTKALIAARKNGDDEFVVSGKKYKVEDYKEDDEEEKKDVKEGKEEDEEEDKEHSEASEKQKKYQAFFDKALKKFGVKSPSELEGDKKKEFFDYVDANYEADNETD